MALAFAILCLVASLIFSWMVVLANAMSSSPGPFVGGWLLIAAWAFTAFMWAGWWFRW